MQQYARTNLTVKNIDYRDQTDIRLPSNIIYQRLDGNGEIEQGVMFFSNAEGRTDVLLQFGRPCSGQHSLRCPSRDFLGHTMN